MRKIIFFLLVIFLFAQLGFGQIRGSGLRGAGSTITGITSDGDTITFTLPEVHQAYNRFESTIEMSSSITSGSKWYDSDGDSVLINPAGFDDINSTVAGDRAFQIKDGATELFSVDTVGNVNIPYDRYLRFGGHESIRRVGLWTETITPVLFLGPPQCYFGNPDGYIAITGLTHFGLNVFDPVACWQYEDADTLLMDFGVDASHATYAAQADTSAIQFIGDRKSVV